MSADGMTVRIWEHRAVLFDRIGYGPHRCHWCGRCVRWVPGAGGGGGDVLVADHVDGDRRNNDPGNLVPSCQGCNAHRDRRVADSELFIERQGKRRRAVAKSCETCGAEYLTAMHTAEASRFCSRRCIWDRSR